MTIAHDSRARQTIPRAVAGEVVALYVAGVFAASLAWEMAQMPLYATRMTLGRCLFATAGDLAWTLLATAAAFAAARVARRAFWPVLIASALSIAVLVEHHALSRGRWSYSPAMPTLAGIGLSPLLQLVVVSTIAWLVARRAARSWTRRRAG